MKYRFWESAWTGSGCRRTQLPRPEVQERTVTRSVRMLVSPREKSRATPNQIARRACAVSQSSREPERPHIGGPGRYQARTKRDSPWDISRFRAALGSRPLPRREFLHAAPRRAAAHARLGGLLFRFFFYCVCRVPQFLPNLRQSKYLVGVVCYFLSISTCNS